ncbi:MFS transporter [Eggerthella sp. YY7918]|uniref:MFS transporter n=1 Tax=Eggerthella sp. (strain YY7918) TaxID=502558 RepID=UPI0002171753|nr:MFS transporter [Eggerthella sp. YY7918]BAK45600.1 nitrate/nitrite transporter [Eggerthella sp. YY7918]
MKTKLQLPLQTGNLVVGFMVWVILSSLLPAIQHDIALSPDQIALATAAPVVLGSILRVPFGYCAGLFGARAVFIAGFVGLLIPVWLISEASSFQELLVGGVFLGLGGALFSVGVTSLPHYYPKHRHGFVNGVYGLGNMGTAFSTWLAPMATIAFGWRMTVKLYLVLLAVCIVLNLVLGDSAEAKTKTPVAQQMRVLMRDKRLWGLSLFYFITFGAFVALTMQLPMFLTSSYAMESVDAGIATSIFIVGSASLRVVGGWLADRFNCRPLLGAVFSTLTVGAVILMIAGQLPIYLAGVYLIGIACGIGNGVVFKLVPTCFQEQAGLANGIVSMMGGLGGFFPPLLLFASADIFGTQAPALAALGALCVVCLGMTLAARKHDLPS